MGIINCYVKRNLEIERSKRIRQVGPSPPKKVQVHAKWAESGLSEYDSA